MRVKGKNSTSRDFTVRRQKVLEALLWLQANNPLYEDIEIDETVVRSLPVDGEPHEVTQYDDDDVPDDDSDSDIDLEEGVDEGPREASRAHDGCEEKPVYECESGIVTGMPVAHERAMKAAHIERAQQPMEHEPGKKRRRKRGTVHDEGDSEPEEDDTPMTYPDREGIIDEFNSPGYIALAFPHLFPYGIGDVTQERLGDAVPMKDYFRHLMRYYDARNQYRFQSDLRFRYFAFNSLQRWRAMSISRAFVRLGQCVLNADAKPDSSHRIVPSRPAL